MGMRPPLRAPLVLSGLFLSISTAAAVTLTALEVPPEVELPGTQPHEVGSLSTPEQCDNCHGGYALEVEPAHNWRGSLMSQASTDPLFWATVAVSEQDFDGAGDLCLRCHIADGWLGGRSTPTDGSDMGNHDAGGVSCHQCHRLVNPDGSEHPGVQNAPYLAHDEGTPAEGYYGSGMMVLIGDDVRMGPYSDAGSNNHDTAKSLFHRSGEFCGTCHDVSNPVTGNLAHNNGSMVPLDPGTFDGVLGGSVDGKAGFNNFPWAYGTVERTYSEWRLSTLSTTLVDDYDGLPEELQEGAIEEAWVAAMASSADGNYLDGDPRYFTCQTCHMRPTSGKGAKQNSAPVRDDLPHHDMTGGSVWMPDAVQWLDQNGGLQLGGPLSDDEIDGLNAGKARALHNLETAAELEVEGDVMQVVNLTGHKLPTGYPEGRRMWLNVRWLDSGGGLLREDGEYGDLAVQIDGAPATVRTLLDPDDPNLRMYEIHPGMTQEWAQQLVGLGYPTTMALTYDRETGDVVETLGDLAGAAPGTVLYTYHFALNNVTVSDTRIPPYGLPYDEALERSILPVPANQYGDPGPGGTYEHADEFTLDPPTGAKTAELRLLYQSTSWEFLQFLELANDGSVSFLADTGLRLRQAWQATGMAEPVVMATEAWQAGDDELGTRYCSPAVDNSSGQPGMVHAWGSDDVSDQDLTLTADQLPPNQFGYFLVSDTQGFVANPGGSQGNLCLDGTVGRFVNQVQSSGPSGTFGITVDMTSLPAPLDVPIQPGDTWNFTTWFRDKNPTSTSNFTDGVSVTFS